MKKRLTVYFTIFITSVFILNGAVMAQTNPDTLGSKVSSLSDKVSGIEERVTTAENDLAKLTKIKISGYIQAQWQHLENPSVYPGNYFSVRRARLKVVYEPVTGIAFVLQPDFSPGALALKDAYAQVNEPWLKTFSLWAGQFNRPNYEVEYSSSNREVAERSLVIRTLYPGERAIGAKLEVAHPSVPLRIQLALFNGNDGHTINDISSASQPVNINPVNRDYDNGKDFMGRATYGFRFGNLGGLTIGANYYYGVMKASSTTTLASDYSLSNGSVKIGSNLDRNWFGAEMQLYLDLLGGLSVKGEYLTGKNSYTGAYATASVTGATSYALHNDTLTLSTTTTSTTYIRPNMVKNFQGFYIYLVKNIGKHHQVAVRYDYYDPNKKLKGAEIGLLDKDGNPVYGYNGSSSRTETSTTYSGSNPVNATQKITKTVVTNTLNSDLSDLATSTVTLAYSYYFSENIKFMVDYDIVMNEKCGVNPNKVVDGENVGYIYKKYTVNNVDGYLDYSKVIKQNMLTLRVQVKF
jgi:hypothetical protein